MANISSNVKDRVLEIAENKGISKEKFFEELGVSYGNFKGNSKKSALNSTVLAEISTKYPDVNLKWLLTGEGSMFIKKEVIALGKKVPMRLKPEEFADAFPEWPGIPVYNQPISASFVQHYRDENTYEPLYHLRDPRFKDCDFAAIITGDSMHSEIRHGDYVVCKEIKDRSLILFGDIYYVSTKNGMETCKYVNADPDDKHSIMLVPKNQNISPTSMKKSMIDRLYKVKGIIRGY